MDLCFSKGVSKRLFFPWATEKEIEFCTKNKLGALFLMKHCSFAFVRCWEISSYQGLVKIGGLHEPFKFQRSVQQVWGVVDSKIENSRD